MIETVSVCTCQDFGSNLAGEEVKIRDVNCPTHGNPQQYDERGRKIFNVGVLSFRDQAAIAAMESILSVSDRVVAPEFYADIVAESFDIADAMNAERQKRGDK